MDDDRQKEALEAALLAFLAAYRRSHTRLQQHPDRDTVPDDVAGPFVATTGGAHPDRGGHEQRLLIRATMGGSITANNHRDLVDGQGPGRSPVVVFSG
jgi:hypothetical protein